MVGAHARGSIAAMEHTLPFRNRAMMKNPRDTVRALFLAVVDLSVTVVVDAAHPRPAVTPRSSARRLIDALPEADLNGYRHAMVPAAVVLASVAHDCLGAKNLHHKFQFSRSAVPATFLIAKSRTM